MTGPGPAGPGSSFCDILRADVEDLWQATLTHPFLAEIEQGTLPDEKLLFYFIQNVHHIDAAIAFNAEAAAKAPDTESLQFALRLLDFGRAEVPRRRAGAPCGAGGDLQPGPALQMDVLGDGLHPGGLARAVGIHAPSLRPTSPVGTGPGHDREAQYRARIHPG